MKLYANIKQLYCRTTSKYEKLLVKLLNTFAFCDVILLTQSE